MRPINKNTVFYSPDTPPFRPEELHGYLDRELQKIKVAIDLLALGHIDKIFILPERPRDGDIRFFAENITPGGSSAGFYGYYDGSWKKLG